MLIPNHNDILKCIFSVFNTTVRWYSCRKGLFPQTSPRPHPHPLASLWLLFQKCRSSPALTGKAPWPCARSYLGGIDCCCALGRGQQGHIELRWNVTNGWDFVLIWAPGAEDAFWGVVQFLHCVKPETLHEGSFHLHLQRGSNERTQEVA